MKFKITLLAFLALFISKTHAQFYIIDASHSTVQIQVERFGVVDVTGRFKELSGKIEYDPEKQEATSAEAIINVNSYDANNKGGEDAVKNVFLEAEKHPEIKFTSNGVELKDGKHFLTGALTIHGVTNTIELPFSIKGPLMDLATQKQSIAFNASITINRQDYGISFDRKLPNGIKLVGDDVKITLNILAIAE